MNTATGKAEDAALGACGRPLLLLLLFRGNKNGHQGRFRGKERREPLSQTEGYKSHMRVRFGEMVTDDSRSWLPRVPDTS